MAAKKGITTNFFHPSLLLLFLDPGSEIRDPGSETRDPGSEIRDPGSEARDPGSEMGKIQDPGKTSRIRNTAGKSLQKFYKIYNLLLCQYRQPIA